MRAEGEEVPAQRECEVVGRLHHPLVEDVRVREALGTSRQVRVRGVPPHEDERLRNVGWPVVRDRGAPHNQLVGKPVGERRGPVGAHRPRVILHGVPAVRELVSVARVGKRRRTRVPQAVRVNQLVLVRTDERPRQLQVAVRAQLVVELGEQVRLRVVDLRSVPISRVEAVRQALQDGPDRVRAGLSDADTGRIDRVAGIGPDLHARRERAIVVPQVARHEEVQPVPDNRAADREPVLLLLIVRHGHRDARRVGPHEILILAVAECRAVKRVRAGLGDGVDEAAHEAALAHVERRNQHLVFLDGLERERSSIDAATRTAVAGAEVEEIVVDGAVNLNVVEAVVLPGERAAYDLGRRTEEVVEAAVQGRQPAQRGVRDQGLRAGAAGRQQRIGLCRDGHGRHFDGGTLEREVDRGALPQRELERRALRGLEAQRPHLERIGPAHFDVFEVVAPILRGPPRVALPGGPVHQRHGCARDGGAGFVAQPARDRGGSDALRPCNTPRLVQRDRAAHAREPQESLHGDGLRSTAERRLARACQKCPPPLRTSMRNRHG